MRRLVRIASIPLAALMVAPLLAQGPGTQHDPRAIEVLNQMDAYTGAMNRFVIRTESYNDALFEGLIVSKPTVSEISVDRANSLHATTFDGQHTSEIFIHRGQLTVFDSDTRFYAQVEVPEVLAEALLFALDEFDVEAPLLDLLVTDKLDHFLTGDEWLAYVTDRSPIRGVDCHHLLVTGPHADLQLWIEQGDRPLPRKTVMTFKNVVGLPRHEVFIDWSAAPDLDAGVFEFRAPEEAVGIELLRAAKEVR